MKWLDKAPVIDGDLSDWNMDSGVAVHGTKGRSAKIAVAHDAQNLYLAFDVTGAKMVNKGGNWQTLFITGDCDDFMFHASAYAAHFSPAEGDERLLLSVFQGQPIAVLYKPVVSGTTAPTRLMGATIDQIVKLPSAKIGIQRSADGYTLEASVPLSDLGIDPAQGTIERGDVGVVYADETGANRSLRLYYYNHDTSMTADLTTEATLQPGNWGEIEMPLGQNPIKNGDFEEPLATKVDQGWFVSDSKNGGSADINGDVSYSGNHSLRLRVTTPVDYTPDSFKLPDYDAFVRSGNGGKGGGFVEVRQNFPVVGGMKYNLRFHLHTEGFPGGENKDPGPNRGYVALETWMEWIGADGRANGREWITNWQDSEYRLEYSVRRSLQCRRRHCAVHGSPRCHVGYAGD